MEYLINLIVIGVTAGMVYGLMALGMALIYRGLDILHFAHGEMVVFGAFFGYNLFVDINFPFWLALILSMFATAVMGIVIERVFYRRLTLGGGGYTVAGMGMAICGFGMSVILKNLAYLIWNPTPRPLPVDFGSPVIIEGIYLPISYFWIIGFGVLVMLVLNLFLTKTKYGIATRAVAHNKDISFLVGINVPFMISLIFGIAAGLAAAGGVLVAPMHFIEIEMGLVILLKGFASSVVGGFGSLPGAIFGGLIVGIFESLGSGYLDGNLKDVYAFVLMIIVLYFKPNGLFGYEVEMKA